MRTSKTDRTRFVELIHEHQGVLVLINVLALILGIAFFVGLLVHFLGGKGP